MPKEPRQLQLVELLNSPSSSSIELANVCKPPAYKPEVCKQPSSDPPRIGSGLAGPGRKKKQSTKTILEKWNAPGPQGFWNWVDDIQPRVLTRSNRYEVWTPTNKQREVVGEILAVNDKDQTFLHSMSLLVQPRRHGKSTIFALICLWFICSRQNFTTQLLGTQESHTRRVMFNLAKRIIANTPKLSRMIPENNILLHEISFPPLDSRIQMTPGVSFSGSFGERLNVLWCSDLMACPDLMAWNAFQASLLDSENSLCFIDSNVDMHDGVVDNLQKEAKLDDTIFCDYVHYRDLTHYCEACPPWIDTKKAARLKRTLLEVDFKRDILGQRSAASNSLFPKEIRKLCYEDYKTPVPDLQSIVKGRSFKVGAGLDRAKNLSGAFGGDSTVLTIVLKLASPEHGEPIFYILEQEVFTLNTSRQIKKSILKAHEKYHIDNMIFEAYEISDLFPWVLSQNIPCESLSATSTAQNQAFPEMHRIMREGRLRYNPKILKTFESELETFIYTQLKGGKGYSFGHGSKKSHDDTCYSTCWAIHSLREHILNLYVLGSFACKNKSRKRELCYLMGRGSDLQLLCSERCHAHQQVEEMWREYRQLRMDDEITIPEFFETHVRHVGARISQAA